MAEGNGELSDYRALRSELVAVVERLADPEAKASGSDAAALSRTRRVVGQSVSPDYLTDLRADYQLLGKALPLSRGAGAAAVVQERRMLRRAIASLSAPRGESKVEQLDSWRAARAAASGAPRRRGKSG